MIRDKGRAADAAGVGGDRPRQRTDGDKRERPGRERAGCGETRAAEKEPRQKKTE